MTKEQIEKQLLEMQTLSIKAHKIGESILEDCLKNAEGKEPHSASMYINHTLCPILSALQSGNLAENTDFSQMAKKIDSLNNFLKNDLQNDRLTQFFEDFDV